jgi:hypothetical protein
MRIARQAKRADGNIAVRVLSDRQNAFWTATGWSSENAMKSFMRATPHGPVMRKLLEWCDEAALVHWEQPTSELPSWQEAHVRIQNQGRSSKVNHPSPAQTAFAIPSPAPPQNRELRFK